VTALLRTPRLVLRPLGPGDADALWPLVSDPELPRHMSWSAHRDPSETAGWLAATSAACAAGSEQVWAIVVGDEHGPAMGTIGLHAITRQLRAWRVDRAELGYWIAPSLHGRGFMSEAAREVVRHGFAADGLALHKIIVGCVPENGASRRVIEKLGFRFLCEHRDHVYRDGRWWNQLSWELLADEYSPG